MATENIKYSGGVIFSSRFTPTGKQPLDTRTIVTSLPSKASDFESSAAYEGMIVSLLPDHKLFMLTSTLENILANEDLQWKEVGAEQEIPSLDGYATEEYVDNELASFHSSYIVEVENEVDNVRTLAQTAYDMAYTIAYGEGVSNAIDTIKDITYWLNNDPNNAVDLITRMSKVEEELGSLENYDDTEVRNLITENTEDITYIYDKIEAIESAGYDDSELRNLINKNTEDITYIYDKIEAIESAGYDDAELRGLIKNNSDAITEINKIDLGDSNLWKNNQTGEALIIVNEGETQKEILSIDDYTEYIKKQSSLQWDII